jgi:hypothetical protein
MAKLRSKQELSEYLSFLYDCIEREQTSEPSSAAGFLKEIHKLEDTCRDCGVDISVFRRNRNENSINDQMGTSGIN